MAIKFFGAISLTGNAVGDLDAIPVANIEDEYGAVVLDHANQHLYLYTYDASSAAAADGITVIDPADNTGNGRWLLVTLQSAQWSGLRGFLDSSDMGTALQGIGLDVEHVWIPAGMFNPNSTNGCQSLTTYEYATNDIQRAYLAFDAATEEYACFDFRMPSTWDRGTVKFRALWAPDKASGLASAAETCEWQLQAVAVGNDDAIDAAFTDAGEVISDTVTAGVEDDHHETDASPAITVNGTPALGDLVTFKLSRNVGGTDDMVGDAWLFGIVLEIKHSNAVTAWS